MAIAISAGTTTYALAQRLADIPSLTVVTNSIRVTDVLHHTGRPDQTIILTGGVRTPVGGPRRTVRGRGHPHGPCRPRLRGVHGMDPQSGFTCPNLLEADTDRALIEAGRRLVVVADHTKWGVIGISSIARFDQVDVLITDAGLRLTFARCSSPRSVSCWSSMPRVRRNPSTVPSDEGVTDGLLPAELASDPHRRHNPLIDEWVLVSAGRSIRPWLGAEEPEVAHDRPTYVADCYLCPGNVRANGNRNPDYGTTFVFDNDFAALRADTSEATVEHGLLRAEGERGVCRVVCFSPRHDLTLATMSPEAIGRVIDVWAEQTSELGRDYRWVQVFENRGAAMGASNPHPHGQIWAGTALPVEADRESASQAAYLARTGHRLLLDYVAQESGGPRVVVESDEWLVVVPFWAAWPFETLLIPRRPAARLPELDAAARDDLADVLLGLLGRYDGLFRRPFPYSMGWHQAPFGAADDTAGWQVHAHFYPPLLRATVRKFMVGYELLAETQRDLTAEDAAERLRAVQIVGAGSKATASGSPAPASGSPAPTGGSTAPTSGSSQAAG